MAGTSRARGKASKTAPFQFRSRIVGHGEENPVRIVENASNWRQHPDSQADILRDVMDHVGVVDEVIVNRRTGRLVNGHLRVRLAREAGHNAIPVKYVDLDEDEERIILASFDAIGAMATVDESALRALADGWATEGGWLQRLAELTFDAYDLELSPSDPPREDEDDVPEVSEQTVSRIGDLWHLGDHLLLCGDATNADNVRQLGVHGHLMVTDPPYGVNYDPDWRNRDWVGARSVGVVIADDVADWSPAWALFRGDVAYVWSASFREHLIVSGSALIASGFELRSQIIWRKQHFAIGRGNYHFQHEPCWYAVRKGRTAHWTGDRTQSTIWDVANASAFGGSTDGETKTVHSTQKPVEIMRRPMLNNSKPGDLVYEPFCGSGSTIIAAESTKRRARCIEIDPAYVDVAVRRWQIYTGQAAALDGTSETFQQVADGRSRNGP